MESTGVTPPQPPLDPGLGAGSNGSSPAGPSSKPLLLMALLMFCGYFAGLFLLRQPDSEEHPGQEEKRGRAKHPAVTPANAHAGDPESPPEEALGQAGSTSPLVRIESQPSGASLFVNGRLIGSTPLAFEALTQGFYGIRLEKDGHQSKTLRLVVRDTPLNIVERLAPLAVGGLEVDVIPRGAEVLLDGEVVGVSPLKLEEVRAGPHELLIRKTNFEPYAERIEIFPGKTHLYSEFPLSDKILSLLIKQRDSEDQRVGHRIDLAHYYFIIDRIDDAVESFIQAQELADKPLKLPPEMGPEEAALEQRLRNEDRGRLKKEIEKHKNVGLWGAKKAGSFKEKFEEAQDLISRKNVTSWSWVEPAVKDRIRSQEYAKAESLLLEHLAQVPNGPQLLAAQTELLRARIFLRDIQKVEESFKKLFMLAAERPDLLLDIGQALSSQRDRVRPNDRERLLEMAEQSFRRCHERAKSEVIKSECAYELAQVLTAQKHPEVAIEYYKQAIAGTNIEETKDERTYAMAEALRQSGQIEEAKRLFQTLTQSKVQVVRERAKAGLVMVSSP